jgi:AbrB family looped-hinge helix DNA binding protein
MDTASVTSKGQLVIPVRLRRKYGIEPGTKVRFVERDHEILIRPVTKEYVGSLCGLFKYPFRRRLLDGAAMHK